MIELEQRLTELEKRQTAFAAEYNITLLEYQKLVKALTYTELLTCLELLKSKSHKSGTRAYFAKEVRRWLSGQHLGSKPFSPADFKKAEPSYHVNIELPK